MDVTACPASGQRSGAGMEGRTAGFPGPGRLRRRCATRPGTAGARWRAAGPALDRERTDGAAPGRRGDRRPRPERTAR